MKNKLFRRAAVLTAALFSLTCMSVTAYAQSDEPAEETTPPVATETVAKPFTPDGTGTVVDNATDEDGKEFFTITTEYIWYISVINGIGKAWVFRVYASNRSVYFYIYCLSEIGFYKCFSQSIDDKIVFSFEILFSAVINGSLQGKRYL